ncbi:MAG: TIGR00730 family Rossman fold protein [Porphyromonadaceae bacterium]|nr:TIGR00730 family Rossman fold protein [Porphyromonadaceae bacterium]
MRTIRTVCVYCASSSRVAPVYFEAARTLGRLLAERNIRCVYGAGGTGLMGALADAVLQKGGEITGIIPQFMYAHGWCHPGLKEVEVTTDIHSRKQRMATLSDGVIALPGGCGTLEELLEIITWKQLGLYLHPIVLLNINGYYDPLLQMLHRASEEHFMRPEHQTMWSVSYTPQEAVELLYSAPEWDENQYKLAVI